jgi:hypothetical protein
MEDIVGRRPVKVIDISNDLGGKEESGTKNCRGYSRELRNDHVNKYITTVERYQVNTFILINSRKG